MSVIYGVVITLGIVGVVVKQLSSNLRERVIRLGARFNWRSVPTKSGKPATADDIDVPLRDVRELKAGAGREATDAV